MNINKQHKDRLFKNLFGDERRKENTLALYNALNGTQYEDTDALEITTIDDAIYMGMKNDVAFIVYSDMSLYEQQSTFNPNMPVRGLMYAGKLYSKYIEQNDLNIYGSKSVKLPSPHYYVFYNGEQKHNDVEELKLSDTFENFKDLGKYEWTAVMLNINYGHNKELMEKCQPLQEYSILVSKIRKYKKTEDSFENAVNRAVDECIEEGVLADYLRIHKAEVLDMVITEYDEEKTMKAIARDHEEIGEEKMAALISKLYELGRGEEAKLAAQDVEVRKKLYKEFGIE